MKKMALSLLTLVVLLTAFSALAHATLPTEVAGELSYMARFKVHDDSGQCVPPDDPEDPRTPCIRMADGNTFAETYEDAVWTGGFAGVTTDDCRVVIHSSGAWSYKAIASFQGTVGDREGTLQIAMDGKRPSGDAEWQGRWMILDGDGELATLHGQGTWSGFGAPDVWVWGDISYEGKIHFDPD
jgi:hypothetical protein